MGIRVIKTAIAAVIALYAAYALDLQVPIAAGLLAILGVDVTRKKSLKHALARIAGSFLGLLFAISIFYIFGFHAWVFGLYILIAYPLLSKVKLKDGIITSSVLVLQIYTHASMDPGFILNQTSLLLLGLGSAMVVNMIYMPSPENDIRKQKEKTENAMSCIFMEISKHLRDPSYVWSGSQIIEASNAIAKGKQLAQKAAENTLFHADDEWEKYFEMRGRQLETIKRMLVLLARVYEDLPYGEMVAELFEELSPELKNDYYTGTVSIHLQELEKRLKSMPLPSTREEFETRSAILQIILDLKLYLTIAEEEKKKPAPQPPKETMSKSS